MKKIKNFGEFINEEVKYSSDLEDKLKDEGLRIVGCEMSY